MPHSTLEPHWRTAPKRTPEERLAARERRRALYALPIYQLPAEIMLNILYWLQIGDFPSLIVAAWHLLRHHGIAENILTPRLRLILIEPRRGFYVSLGRAADPSNDDDKYIPPDLRHLILNRLTPRDEFFRSFTSVALRLRGGFDRLPAELRDDVFRGLDPADNINVVLACFRFSDQDIEWLTHETV